MRARVVGVVDGDDLAWLGLERHGDGRWSFELTRPLTRPDGKLYGGAGIAVATATMEAETGRAALWSTVQFAASADLGDTIDCHVEVLASGRRTSQVRTTASCRGRLVLAALGATGSTRDGAVDGHVGEMPDRGTPDDGTPWRHRFTDPSMAEGSWFGAVDMRHVDLDGGAMAIWAQVVGRRHSRATLGYVADMVPPAVAAAFGRFGGGTSLDNSMRYGPEPDCEWVLLDFDPYLATGGYLAGAARVWSDDGVLLGVASQTATAMFFEPGEQP